MTNNDMTAPALEFAPVNVGETSLIGIVNESGMFFPNRFYVNQEEADTGMLALARDTVNRINTHYESRRKVNEDGNLSKPGRRSDYDIALLEVSATWIDTLAAAAEEKAAVERFLAGLSPEARAAIGK